MPEGLFVLDTHAVLAYLGNEKGAEVVGELLGTAAAQDARVPTLLMSYVNLGEVFYVVMREEGEDKAAEVLATVKNWRISFSEAGEMTCLAAGRIKGGHAISYADAFALATAALNGAALVTGDPEFKKVEHLYRIKWIREA